MRHQHGLGRQLYAHSQFQTKQRRLRVSRSSSVVCAAFNNFRDYSICSDPLSETAMIAEQKKGPNYYRF